MKLEIALWNISQFTSENKRESLLKTEFEHVSLEVHTEKNEAKIFGSP